MSFPHFLRNRKVHIHITCALTLRETLKASTFYCTQNDAKKWYFCMLNCSTSRIFHTSSHFAHRKVKHNKIFILCMCISLSDGMSINHAFYTLVILLSNDAHAWNCWLCVDSKHQVRTMMNILCTSTCDSLCICIHLMHSHMDQTLTRLQKQLKSMRITAAKSIQQPAIEEIKTTRLWWIVACARYFMTRDKFTIH